MQREGFSIEAKKDICKEDVARNNLLHSDEHVYIDEAYSAKTDDLPAFKRILQDTAQVQFSQIITQKRESTQTGNFIGSVIPFGYTRDKKRECFYGSN